jgi:hypothetical protein
MKKLLLIVLIMLGMITACSTPMSNDNQNYRGSSDRVGPDILQGSDTGTPSDTAGSSSGNSGPPTGY